MARTIFKMKKKTSVEKLLIGAVAVSCAVAAKVLIKLNKTTWSTSLHSGQLK